MQRVSARATLADPRFRLKHSTTVCNSFQNCGFHLTVAFHQKILPKADFNACFKVKWCGGSERFLGGFVLRRFPAQKVQTLKIHCIFCAEKVLTK